MLDRINRNHRWIVALLFVIMIVAGLLVTPDYGMPWDEKTEIGVLGSDIREYIGLFSGQENEPAQSSTGIPFLDASENVDIDHGQSVYYLFSPALFFHYNEGGARTLMLLWHGYTFLVFMAGVAALYCIVSFLTMDWKYGLAASLFLYLSPRFFAEGHYNNKDLMAMVMILLCLWFFIRWMEKRSVSSALLFALFGALATNMRISGLLFFGLAGVFYLVRVTVQKEWNRKNLLLGLIALFGFVAFYFALTPGAWLDPAKFLRYIFARSANFSDWPGYVYYMGKSCRPVPWHYIPVMIALTTPPLIVLLMLAGNVAAMINTFRVKASAFFSGATQYVLLCVLFVWTFLGYTMIRQPILYDSWRHFYFLAGLLYVLAAYGLEQIISLLQGKWKWVGVGAVGLQLFAMLIIIVMNHPFQFVYYNQLAGTNPGERYDLDYWNVSQAQALMRLVDTIDPDEAITVTATDWYTGDGLDKAYSILPARYQSRIRLIFIGYYQMARGADYVMVNPRGLQLCRDKTQEPRQTWLPLYGMDVYLSGLNKVVSLNFFGSEFMAVYQMP